jgi:Dna[CI] antecedent, DciA
VARFNEQPKTIGDLLNIVAGRLRKVDIRAIDQIRELWPNIVDPVLAEKCRPEFIKNGVLLITVPSGAYAQRISSESNTILEGFSPLGESAPTALRTVLENK